MVKITEEIKKGLVLKVSIIVICLSVTAMVYRFAGTNTNIINEENVIDTILTLTPSSVETLNTKRIHTWPESVKKYDNFYDVPAGADSIIIVKGKWYSMNDKKTNWILLNED